MAPYGANVVVSSEALLDDPSGVLRHRVLRATRLLLAERGLGISMDDIAAAADVGRRSLFRHFDSKDALVAEALGSALDWYDQQVDTTDGDDRAIDAWLPAVVTRIHELHRTAGRGLWQLAAASDDDLADELRAVSSRRRTNRRTTTEALAREAWRRGGGTGTCPRVVVDAFALSLSSYATHSMLEDLGLPVERVVACTCAALTAVVRDEAGRRAQRGRSR